MTTEQGLLTNDWSSATTSVWGFVVFALLMLAQWKMFVKAGEPGWKTLIPLYNTFVLTKIATGNGLLFLLLLLPVVNVVFWLYLMFRLAQSFGKGIGYTLGLIFLNPIFTLLLGFGEARYVGPQN